MSDYYGLADADEAGAYLADPVLGPRLEEISAALLDLEGRSAREIFGYPDCMKLWSCMTLFEAVSGDDSVFRRVLDMYYGGERDQGTMQLMDKG